MNEVTEALTNATAALKRSNDLSEIDAKLSKIQFDLIMKAPIEFQVEHKGEIAEMQGLYREMLELLNG